GDFPFGSVLGRAGTHRVRNLIGATGPLARRPGSQPGPGPALGDHGGGSRSGGGRAGPGSGGAATRPAPQIPLTPTYPLRGGRTGVKRTGGTARDVVAFLVR